jgi:tetratricopeptide (TPR) repeat protein
LANWNQSGRIGNEQKPLINETKPMDFLNPKVRSEVAQEHGVSSSHSSSATVTQPHLFNTVITYCLFALVFLVPLFFLPLTSEIREFNKQNLLIFGVLVMLGAWVIKILSTRHISWVKTSLDYVVIGYGLIYILSSYLSLDKASSFLGYYGRFTGSTLSVLALVLMYFVIVNNIRTAKVTQRIVNALMLSTGLVTIYSLLQLFGWYVLPRVASGRSFNPVGSMVALSIFGAISVLLYQWQLLAETHQSIVKKATVWVFMLLSLVMMFIVNAFIGWLVLAVGMIVFMALGMIATGADTPNQTWFWRPMIVLVIAILFVAFQVLPASINPRNMAKINLPIEIQLSNSATFNLVTNSMKTGGKTAILGSGPGTTGIAFGEIKPEDLNKTVVWSLNFDRASSEIANIAIETGILGLLVFEATSILFLFYGLFFLLRKSYHPGRMYAYLFFVLWAALYLTHFFYFFNTTFYFLYWLSIASFMAVAHWSDESEAENISFVSSPRSALSWMFASLIMLAVILVGAFFEASVYVAEASYASGVKNLNQPNPDFTKVQNQFARAISLNPYRDVYNLGYAQDLIFLSSIEAAKKDGNIQNINTWLRDAVNAGQNATKISPNKAANWSALAQLYNAIQPLGVQGTAGAASKQWEQAIQHDSKNPALYVQLAASYSDASSKLDPAIAGTGADADHDGLSDEMEKKFGSDSNNSDTNGNGFLDGDEVKSGFNPARAGRLDPAIISQFTKIDNALLKKAEDALNKAISLKADLPDSYIALARVYEKEKKLPDAKKVLDSAAIKFPYNPNIRFEQGRITYNNGDVATAEKIFLDVINRLQPKHADSLFSLGLIYEKSDPAKALNYYKQVREITGPNVGLDTRINALQNPAPPAGK